MLSNLLVLLSQDIFTDMYMISFKLGTEEGYVLQTVDSRTRIFQMRFTVWRLSPPQTTATLPRTSSSYSWSFPFWSPWSSSSSWPSISTAGRRSTPQVHWTRLRCFVTVSSWRIPWTSVPPVLLLPLLSLLLLHTPPTPSHRPATLYSEPAQLHSLPSTEIILFIEFLKYHNIGQSKCDKVGSWYSLFENIEMRVMANDLTSDHDD